MKKSILVFCLLLFAGSAIALPSFFGLRGLNRIVDAKPIGAGEFSLALFGNLGLSKDTRNAYIGGTHYDVEDTEYDGTGYFTIGIGLGEKVELGGRVTYVWNALKRADASTRIADAGDNETDDGFSEAGLSFKIEHTYGRS